MVTNKSTYIATTFSTKNLTNVILKSATTKISGKVGKSLQIKIPTVGSKRVGVRVTLKDPSNRTYTITSTTIEKNAAFLMPKLNFSKPGLYTISLYLGTSKKIVTVKIAP
ncbi:unannotated protein [freshwater metagenome]|uniref:Unannotated protein n=1 Tax=freshwater metagenome TaxID=449393 RepID=A0A6J6BSB3_9ZZZZ